MTIHAYLGVLSAMFRHIYQSLTRVVFRTKWDWGGRRVRRGVNNSEKKMRRYFIGGTICFCYKIIARYSNRKQST